MLQTSLLEGLYWSRYIMVAILTNPHHILLIICSNTCKHSQCKLCGVNQYGCGMDFFICMLNRKWRILKKNSYSIKECYKIHSPGGCLWLPLLPKWYIDIPVCSWMGITLQITHFEKQNSQTINKGFMFWEKSSSDVK